MKSLLILSLFIAKTVLAQEPDSSSALFNMREAELNFARESVMYGRQAAFVNNFADESIVFTDKWVKNGRQVSKERKGTPVVLKWEPEFMDISASRDFGISTGPSEAQEYRPNTAPVYTGYFLSVWKKQSGGVWKVILDVGYATPPLSDSRHRFVFPAGADKSVPDPPVMIDEVLSKELVDRDNQFHNEWKSNPVIPTYTSFLSPDIRMQGNGHLPTTNPDTIKKWIAHLDKKLSWKPVGAGAASSGDLGFTYGLLESANDSKVKKGHYVRIWRKLSGSWKIILEMMNFI